MPKKIVVRKKMPKQAPKKNKAVRTKHGYASEEQMKFGGTIGEADRRAFKAAAKELKKK